LGGAAALVYPTVLVILSMSAGFRAGGDYTDLATSFLGAILFLVAAPTGWLFAIDFIDAGRFTVIASAVVTSIPLWWMLGVWLARASDHWTEWTVRYLGVCLAWTVAQLLLLAVFG
jgi:hypothetical protein